MSKRAVAITGLGVLSPIGQNVAQVVASLRSGYSGIRRVEAEPLSRPIPAGVVPADFEESFTRLERPFMDRVQHFAVLAARQAIEDAGILDFAPYGLRAGVYYGNVNGGASTVQSWANSLLVDRRQASRPFTAMASMCNGGAAQISIRNQILGPVLTHGSACASSAIAIGDAARAIADGHLDVAVAGGAEAPLCACVVGVFAGTRAMSVPDAQDPARSCKPFSQARSGLVLGEGGAFLILESQAHAQARNARIYGYLRGYGVSSDASHIGMPATEGQVRALRAALADAHLAPGDIQYLNAHATATDGGDVIEADSIRAVFGQGPSDAFVSSTKAVHGHLLGATSALELVITILAMNHSVLPASVHMDPVDPLCLLNHVGPTPRTDVPITNALSFSCGFGGTNGALIVSRNPLST
jgi:3-oxoacyl-[acyl-carrier-protein] synthase II